MLSNRDKLLIQAIDRNDPDAVRRALQEGANVNNINNIDCPSEYTPLFRAVQHGHSLIVRVLLDAGAVTHGTNCWRKTAAHKACYGGHLVVLQMLIDHDIDLLEKADFRGWTPLIEATTSQHIEIYHYLVDRGCNLEASDQDGATALIVAARRGHLEIVRLLLAAGVNIEACERSKHTALHCAAIFGQVDVIRELLLHNANICPLDQNGKTPFDLHVGRAMVDVFIQIYCDRLSQGEEGHLALHSLLHHAVYFLEDYYTEPGSWGFKTHHPRVKIQLGTLELGHLRTLLLSVDEELLRNRDDSGRLPIHIACQADAPLDVLVTLVERDPATLHVRDHAGALPLHEFCGGYCDSNIEFASGLQLLVERGGVGTLAARNRDGALPLHVLCASTSSPPLKAVLYLMHSFPSSVATQTNAGLYPFMIAATNASLSLVYEILKANPVLVVPR